MRISLKFQRDTEATKCSGNTIINNIISKLTIIRSIIISFVIIIIIIIVVVLCCFCRIFLMKIENDPLQIFALDCGDQQRCFLGFRVAICRGICQRQK